MAHPFLVLALAAAWPASDEEQALAGAIRSGDRRAFRQLFDRYHQPLFRFLVHRKVPNDVAEDLVQNAFIRLWEQRATLRDDGSLRGLLFRIAYTRALNHFRDTARFDDAEIEAEAGEALPDEAAEGRLIRERLSAVVATLPERRRATFELCMLEGLTYREAANVLGVSMKTVENQMSHALKAVRSALEVHRKKM